MHITSDAAVTTGLLVAFALFVIYIRLKNWFDSNVPIFFYIILIGYMASIDGAIPFWLTCAGFGLTLILRFEFMNTGFTRAVKFLEIGALAAMIYLSVGMILS